MTCSRCHCELEQPEESESAKCPSCGAEAGLEPVKATPFPMRLFAFSLVGAALVAVSGVVFAFVG